MTDPEKERLALEIAMREASGPMQNGVNISKIFVTVRVVFVRMSTREV